LKGDGDGEEEEEEVVVVEEGKDVKFPPLRYGKGSIVIEGGGESTTLEGPGRGLPLVLLCAVQDVAEAPTRSEEVEAKPMRFRKRPNGAMMRRNIQQAQYSVSLMMVISAWVLKCSQTKKPASS
jgi:hypothetical protein